MLDASLHGVSYHCRERGHPSGGLSGNSGVHLTQNKAGDKEMKQRFWPDPRLTLPVHACVANLP